MAGVGLYAARARRDAFWLYAVIPSLIGALTPLLWSGWAALGGATVIDRVSFRVARLGGADLTLGFTLDRTSLGLSLVVLAIVAAVLARAASIKPGRTDTREPAPHEVLFAGAFALAAALADGFFGATLFAGATALVVSLRETGPATGFRFASVALLPVGAALLYWSLGGQWLDDRQFFSDFRARFVVADPSSDRGEPLREARSDGTLTVVSHPGADVYLGVATEPQLSRSNPLGQTPLVRVPVPSGLQKIVIVPGDGAIIVGEGVEAALVDTVNIRPGEETVIALSGSTLTYHEVGAQLDAKGAFVRKEMESGASASGSARTAVPAPQPIVRAALPARRIGTWRLGEVAAIIVGLLALSSALSVGRDGVGGLLVQIVTLGAASRLAPMLDVGVIHYVVVGLVSAVAVYGILKAEPFRAAAAGAAVAVLALNGPAGAIFACACVLASLAVMTPKTKKKSKGQASVDAPNERWLLLALGYPVPVFGLVLPAACVAVSGFERSFTLGVLVCAAMTLVWAGFVWTTLRTRQPVANTRMIASAIVPVLLTLLIRPYVIDGALGRGALLLMLGVWALVAATARLALFRRTSATGSTTGARA